MTIEDRKSREKARMKQLILDTAAQIIIKEGIEKLSIRKIANEIEYSPAIIYHYFENKTEIVNQIMRTGYQELLSSLSENPSEGETPEKRLAQLTRNYIDSALKNPEQFLTVQMNKNREIQDFTAYLYQGALEEKPALKMLAQAIRDIFRDHEIPEETVELTAQIVAASTLGMVIKLILEEDIDENRRNLLIQHFIDSVAGMVLIQINPLSS